MNIEGNITSTNSTLLKFCINNKYNVHMGVLLSQKPYFKLPKFGSKILIKKAHYYVNSDEIFLCENSDFIGEFTVPYSKNCILLKLILQHNLGCGDLLELSTNLKIMQKNFAKLSDKVQDELTIEVFKKIVENEFLNEHESCLNQIVPQFNLLSVKDCRYIDLKSDKYTDFLMWTHGIHSKPKPDNFLFGYFTVSPKHGLFLLKDSEYKMFVILINKDCNRIVNIVNKFVLIKDFKVITELYPESHVQNFEYFLIDFNDIVVIDCKENCDNGVWFISKPDNVRFMQCMNFKILRKSEVQIGENNQPEFWLEIEINDIEKSFLCLPQFYIQIYYLLNENEVYNLYHNKILKVVKQIEFERINLSYKQYELDELSAIFVKQLNTEAATILDTKEAKEGCFNKTELISFQGILKQKFFADPFTSRTKRKGNFAGFGMPDGKTHSLLFFVDNPKWENKNLLKLYLNNWENLITPIGLVPYMRISVRNVIQQPTGYFKSTSFTKIEILSYEPLVNFDTINLHYEDEFLDWGKRSFLGLGDKIPHGVFVWGKVTNLEVIKAKLTNSCTKCNHVTESEGSCENCGSSERNFDVYLILYGSDTYGQSKIITKSKNVLKLLMNLTTKEFDVWLKAFQHVGKFEYNKFENSELHDLKHDRLLFKNSLKNYFEVMSKFDCTEYDLKCQKMRNDSNRPIWLCLEIKKS